MRQNFFVKFESLPGEFGRDERRACDIAPWTRQGFHQSCAHRIGAGRHHDGDGRRRPASGLHGDRWMSDENIDSQTNEFGRESRKALIPSLCGSPLRQDGASLDKADLSEPLP